jgi:phage protein U
MFAQLGDIQFELIQYFESIESTKAYNYSESSRIGRKPKLQFTGESLETFAIKVNFHISFCDPEGEIKKIEQASNSHQALSFVYGNGKYQGKYVITDFNKTPVQTDSLGNIIAIEAQLNLKEYVQDSATTKKKQQPKKQGITNKITTPPATQGVQITQTQSPLPALTQDEICQITRSEAIA